MTDFQRLIKLADFRLHKVLLNRQITSGQYVLLKALWTGTMDVQYYIS